MADIFRDAPARQFVRFLARDRGRLLTYAEERADFVLPSSSGPSTLQNGSKDDVEKQNAESTPGGSDDIVDWYDAHDQDNPQNWSQGKKTFVFVQIVLLTFSGRLLQVLHHDRNIFQLDE